MRRWTWALNKKKFPFETFHTIVFDFDGVFTDNYVYVDSYLFSEKYFSLYADLLGVDENLLKEVGELCSPPDLEKENLIAEVLEINKILG